MTELLYKISIPFRVVLGATLFLLPGVLLTILIFQMFFSDTLSISDIKYWHFNYMTTLESLVLNVSFIGLSALIYQKSSSWRDMVDSVVPPEWYTSSEPD